MLTYNQQQQQHHHLNMGQYGAQRMPPQVIKKMDGTPQGQTQPHQQGPGPADLMVHQAAGTAAPHTAGSGLVQPAPQHQTSQHHLLQPLSFQPRAYGSLDTPSPPTPSPSPGNNHPSVMIPPKMTHLDMSQNSPSTDPSSSPSSPTAGNAATTSSTTTTKKRTRASPEQLAILEDTFLTNQSPNSKVREILAKKVKMSERSIQIWFQNRRAKVKQAQKRLELGQQEAMKAQYLNGGMLGMPQPLYGYPGAPGAAPPNAKGLPMAPHLHPAGLARAPLSRSNSYDAARVGAAPVARFGPHAGLGINVPGAANPALWAGQAPYGVAQPFGMRPTLQQQALLGPRGVKRSFDAANEPLMAGGIPKPLHFPVAEGLVGGAADSTAAAAAAAAAGVSNPNAVFAAGAGIPAAQLPTLPTFDCDNLSIGTWRRMSTSNTDLSCFYCPTTRVMTWQIGDNGAHFKLTFPLTSITRIEFYEVDPLYAQVDFDLSEVPQFFMETVAEDGTREWKKCSDFTEAKQATLVLRHTIHGMSTTLKMQVMSLTIAYPPLQPLTTYREPQFPTQFHAYTTPIPQVAQFMDPLHYDHRRLLGSPMGSTFFGAAAAAAAAAGYDDFDSSDGSDLEGFGMVFHHDGTQPPRPKSRRTASMPNPGMGSGFLSVNMNTIPLHSSPLSMYSTTNSNLDPTAAAITAAASSANLSEGANGNLSTVMSTSLTATTAATTTATTPAVAGAATATTTAGGSGGATVAVTAAAGVATTTAIATSDDSLAANTATSGATSSTVVSSENDSKSVSATNVPKVTVTASTDSTDSTGTAPSSSTTTATASTSEQQDGSTENGSGLGILSAGTTESKEEKTDEMGLTSQFNEFLAQAVVSTTPMAPLGFVGSTPMMHPGMIYATSAAAGHVDDGSVAYGLNAAGGYYSMMHEQASLAGVSLSDVESRLDGAEQTDGEESAY
ncbi:hypothetical protein BGW41_002126 [Actinomortierella wolfii]|nr:hypothetical protein BGW41_002126 [Actinomortierella wolfii]